MEVKIVNEEKGTLDVEISNQTIAEVLRIYLNKQGAKLAAWKKAHLLILNPLGQCTLSPTPTIEVLI